MNIWKLSEALVYLQSQVTKCKVESVLVIDTDYYSFSTKHLGLSYLIIYSAKA